MLSPNIKYAALKVIKRAEKDLGKLSDGERSDLLIDQDVAPNTNLAHVILHELEIDGVIE